MKDDDKGFWLVILANGATNGIPSSLADTPEKAIEITYSGIESSCGLPRDKVFEVVAVMKLTSRDRIEAGLNLYGLSLVNNGFDPTQLFA